MQRLFTEMQDSDRLLPLHVGLDAGGEGSAFIARNFVSLHAQTLYIAGWTACCFTCLFEP